MAIIVLLVIFCVIGGSFVFINYLNDEIELIKQNKELEIALLSKKEQELITQNRLNAMKIEDTLKDIEELSSTLDEIENIIGINKEEKDDLVERVKVAKLTSIEKMKLLNLVPNGSPLKEMKVTASFGYRKHPITKKRQFHKGIDLRAKRGTEVFTTADGVIRYVQSKNKGDFGRMVIVSHALGFETVYAHLKKTKVKIGDIIYKGDTIGLSGNSGRSTGPHLHYEIRYASRVLNPYRFIKWDLKNFDTIIKKESRVPWESLITLINKQEKKLDQQ
jgi:murein DD-endopeptidase MepM/ murein hydrolase activator NlpD